MALREANIYFFVKNWNKRLKWSICLKQMYKIKIELLIEISRF